MTHHDKPANHGLKFSLCSALMLISFAECEMLSAKELVRKLKQSKEEEDKEKKDNEATEPKFLGRDWRGGINKTEIGMRKSDIENLTSQERYQITTS